MVVRVGRGKSEGQSRNDLVNHIQKGNICITMRRWPRQCQQVRRQQQGGGPYARWTSMDEGGDGAVAGGEVTTDDGEHGDDDGRPTQE